MARISFPQSKFLYNLSQITINWLMVLSNAFVRSANTAKISFPQSMFLSNVLQIAINWLMVLSPWVNLD